MSANRPNGTDRSTSDWKVRANDGFTRGFANPGLSWVPFEGRNRLPSRAKRANTMPLMIGINQRRESSRPSGKSIGRKSRSIRTKGSQIVPDNTTKTWVMGSGP